MLQEEHSAILLTFIKLPFVIKIFSPFKTGLTVTKTLYLQHNLKLLYAHAYLRTRRYAPEGFAKYFREGRENSQRADAFRATGLDKQFFQRKNVNIFLSVSFNI